MAISADDLHAAADILGEFGADDHGIDPYGLTADALAGFVLGSSWRDLSADGPERTMDPLALAMGVSIGVIAASREFRG